MGLTHFSSKLDLLGFSRLQENCKRVTKRQHKVDFITEKFLVFGIPLKIKKINKK